MAIDNRISLTFTSEQRAEIEEGLQILQEKLVPLLLELTTAERSELPKMGDKTVAFVMKALEYGRQNPTLVPPYVNLDELQTDLDAVEALRAYYNPLAQIARQLDDSMLLAGSEAYVAALAFYNAVKGAARANVPGAALIYEDLRTRFPGGSRRTAS